LEYQDILDLTYLWIAFWDYLNKLMPLHFHFPPPAGRGIFAICQVGDV